MAAAMRAGKGTLFIFSVKINRFLEARVLWVVISYKCVVKGYQDCRFDVKEGEDFKVLISKKGRAFRKRAQTIRSPSTLHLMLHLITIYPVYHDSDTDACTPFSLRVTVNCP